MKTNLYSYYLVVLLGMGLSGSSNAFTIISSDSNNGVDVGILDIFLTQQASPSGGLGDGDLTTWINNYFSNPNPAITYSTRTEDYTGYATNDSNIAAYALSGSPKYFILHNAHNIALFENKNKLDWAVFNWVDLAQYGSGKTGFNINSAGTKISFIAEFNQENGGGGNTGGQTPEPSIVALMGIGLLGMGASRLRKTKV